MALLHSVCTNSNAHRGDKGTFHLKSGETVIHILLGILSTGCHDIKVAFQFDWDLIVAYDLVALDRAIVVSQMNQKSIRFATHRVLKLLPNVYNTF